MLLLLADLSAGAATLYESDFTRPGQPLNIQGKGTFEGELPAGWIEIFTGWVSCKITGHRLVENGTSFQRFDLNYTKQPYGQFGVKVKGMQAGKPYKLTLVYRSRLNDYFNLCIRQIEEPWQNFWMTRLKPAAEWQRGVYVFQLAGACPEMLIQANPSSRGTLDLAYLKLEDATSEELPASPVIRPAAECKNFFRNSRLPLGLQSGWQVDRDAQTVPTVAGERGPSGENALALTDVRICSEPFQVADPAAQNQVSFSYKGDGSGEATVVNGGGPVQLLPSKEWKRVTLPVAGDGTARAYALTVTASGRLLVDAFQAGPEGSLYTSAGACEIALALPPSALAAERIQFPDEPPRVRYYVSGDVKGAVVRATATDLYGNQTTLGEFTAADGLIDYGAALKKAPLGQFRIEVAAWRAGTRISPFNELVVTRLEKPRYWGKDAPASPFGGHLMANAQTLRLAKAGGLNWGRLHDAGGEYLYWGCLEKEQGQWQFRDKEINLYRQNHLKIFGGLGTAPMWASGRGRLSPADAATIANPYFDVCWAPDSLDEFAHYVKTVTRRYRGVIDEYFVWNEPWGVAFLTGSLDPKTKAKRPPENVAKVFLDLQKTAYDAAKSVDPGIKIAGFNTCGDFDWTQRVYDVGGAVEHCDLIDYHQYTQSYNGELDDTVSGYFKQTFAYLKLKSHGTLPRPVYMSEGQGASIENSQDHTYYVGIYRHTVPWKNNEDYVELSDLNTRFMVSLLAQNVQRIFLYSLHCYTNLATRPQNLVLLQSDGYAHPQLVAHSALAFRLEDKTFWKAVEIKPQVTAFLFAGDAGSTAVIIPMLAAGNYRLSCSLKEANAADLFGNPLAVPMETGKTVRYLEAPVAPEVLLKSLSIK